MNILVFSAHPDDAEFAMGGTLIQLAKEHNITMVVWTNGDAGTYGNAQQRKQEQAAACAQLNATQEWLGAKDCSIQHDNDHIYRAAALIRKHKPHLIFAPHHHQPGDITEGRAHPDHRNIGKIVKDAARFARFNIDAIPGEPHKTWYVLWYMVADGHGKICVGVDDALDELHTLWNCHESQTQLHDGAVCEHLLSWRKSNAAGQQNITHAEIFDCDKPVPLTYQALLFGRD